MRRIAVGLVVLSAGGPHATIAPPLVNATSNPLAKTPLDGTSPEFAIVRGGKVLVDEHPEPLAFSDVTLWAGQPPVRDASCDDDPPDPQTAVARTHECWDNGPNFGTLRGASATVAAAERPDLRATWRNRAVTVYDERGPICQGHTTGVLTAWGSVFASIRNLLGDRTSTSAEELARAVLANHASLFTTLEAPCADRAMFVRDASLAAPTFWSLGPADAANQARAKASITVESPSIQLATPPNASLPTLLIAGGDGEVNCAKVIQGAMWRVPPADDEISTELEALYTAIPEAYDDMAKFQNGDAIGPQAVVDPRGSGWPVIISAGAIYRYNGGTYERIALAELDYDRDPVTCGD